MNIIMCPSHRTLIVSKVPIHASTVQVLCYANVMFYYHIEIWLKAFLLRDLD